MASTGASAQTSPRSELELRPMAELADALCARHLVAGGVSFGLGPAGHPALLTQHDLDDCAAALLDAGVQEFDTSPWYGAGTGEERLGRALRAAVAARGEAVKEAPRVTTKVGRLFLEPDGVTPVASGYDNPERARPEDRIVINDYTAEGALRSFRESLERLGSLGDGGGDGNFQGLEGLRVHDPNDNNKSRPDIDEVAIAAGPNGACEALRELRKSGKIRSVGLGMNCNKEPHQGKPDEVIRLIRLVEPKTFDSALLAGGWNLLTQTGLPCLLECQRQGIDVHIAGIYASGLLAGGETYAYIPAPENMLAAKRRWQGLAEQFAKSLPSVALAFAMLPRCVTRLVVGMATAKEVEDTLRFMKEAHTVPLDLFMEAKRSGLLAADFPLPETS